MTENVLYHHHRAIHHHADADRQPAEAHQVGGQAGEPHANERHQNGEGEGRHHNEGRTQVSEKQVQKDNNKRYPLKQSLLHRADGLFHQRCLGIIRLY